MNILIIACTINLLAVSTVFMTQSIFLEISDFFNIDITQARFSFSVVSSGYAASFFFLGPAADKFDLPKIAVIGLILLATSVFYASCAGGFSLFLIAMALIGICAAFIPAAMFPYIAKTSPQHKAGLYMGAIVASGTLGVIFGRVSMGILTSIFGWQHSFRCVALILFFLSAITFFSLAEKQDGEFNRNQNVSELYINAIRLILDPKILSLLLAGLTLFFGFLGMVTFLTYRLTAPPFDFSSGDVGWISFAGMTALIAPFAGRLAQKIGTHKIVVPSILVCLISFQLMGWSQSLTLTVLGLLLLFLGVYICQPLVFLLVGRRVSKKSIGSASSLYILCCIGGGSLSSIFLGPVWRTHGWSGITIVCTISVLVSLFIMLISMLQESAAKDDDDVNGHTVNVSGAFIRMQKHFYHKIPGE